MCAFNLSLNSVESNFNSLARSTLVLKKMIIYSHKEQHFAHLRQATLGVVVVLFSFLTMATFPDSLLNASFVTDSSSGDEDEPMPWEQDDFIPVTSSGRQRSPNNIRNQLRKYMDASFETETAIIERMGVSYDDFRGFMNPPKEYIKDQWSAVGNSTYWAAARLLEQVRCEAKLTERANKKRKTVGGLPLLRPPLAFGNRGKPTREAKANAQQLMEFVNEVDLPSVVPVYDSYPEVVKKPTLAFGNRGRPSREAKAKAQQFMVLVNEVELPSIVPVYDSCPEVAKKVGHSIEKNDTSWMQHFSLFSSFGVVFRVLIDQRFSQA